MPHQLGASASRRSASSGATVSRYGDSTPRNAASANKQTMVCTFRSGLTRVCAVKAGWVIMSSAALGTEGPNWP